MAQCMENPEEIHHFYGIFDIAATNGDQYLSSDGPWYQCNFFDELGGREDADHFSSSPWNENGGTQETCERERLPYSNGCGNWMREYNTLFGDCWGGDHVSPGNEITNECGGDLKEMNGEEERFDRHFSSHEDTENHTTASDYDSWSCCGSWFPHGEENDPYDDSGVEAETTSSGLDSHGIEVYEGIFGYWPCLHRYN